MATTVGLISLGCSKNRVDSEQALGFLRDLPQIALRDHDFRVLPVIIFIQREKQLVIASKACK